MNIVLQCKLQTESSKLFFGGNMNENLDIFMLILAVRLFEF